MKWVSSHHSDFLPCGFDTISDPMPLLRKMKAQYFPVLACVFVVSGGVGGLHMLSSHRSLVRGAPRIPLRMLFSCWLAGRCHYDHDGLVHRRGHSL